MTAEPSRDPDADIWNGASELPDDPDFYRHVLDASPTPLVVVDDGGNVVYGNQALVEMTGWSQDDGVGTSIFAFLHADDVDWITEAFITLASADGASPDRPWAPVNCRVVAKDGTVLPVEIRGRDQLSDPAIKGLIYEVRPAFERAIFQRVLTGVASSSGINTQLDLIVELITSSPLDIDPAVLEVGPDGSFAVLTSNSDQLTSVLTAAPNEALRDSFLSESAAPVFTSVADIGGPLGEQLASMAEVDAWSVGVPSPTNDRRYLIVAFTPVHHVPARGTIEALTRAAELAAVVLLRARSDELLTYAAHHDQLTQLANRHGLIEHVAAMSPRSEDIAVMFIDLDGFKQINDRHGHAAGDYVLTVLAERIASVTRPIDFVARLGGDEFAVVIGMSPGHPPAPEAAGWVAERILDAFCRPIDSTWGPLEMSGSIGVVTVDPDTDIQAAIAGADRAMYVAKTAGGAQMHRVSDS